MRKPERIDVRTALPSKPNKFLDQLRVFIRSRGLAYATEKTYLFWTKRFINFNHYQSATDFKLEDIEPFLNYLAQQRFCSPNTQYELAWQYLFPSHVYSIDPRSNIERRHHISPVTNWALVRFKAAGSKLKNDAGGGQPRQSSRCGL